MFTSIDTRLNNLNYPPNEYNTIIEKIIYLCLVVKSLVLIGSKLIELHRAMTYRKTKSIQDDPTELESIGLGLIYILLGISYIVEYIQKVLLYNLLVLDLYIQSIKSIIYQKYLNVEEYVFN